jgi:Cd2+/Zn2+-exporting ATPase
VTIGNHPSFDDYVPHPQGHCEWAKLDADQGFTTVMLSVEDDYLGSITLADTLRESSVEAVAQLREMGLQDQIMLTGDEAGAANRIATEVGLSQVRSGLLPEQKVDAVLKLKEEMGVTAMVGDGINDTPALAAADVGLAIARVGGGTAQAMEVADITVLGEDLTRLPFLVRLSRAAMRTVWTNIAMSIGIKVIFLALVLLGLGSMWMAVLADMGTSLLVTLNGMRLLRRPRP